jgi:hypothetical protein
LKGIQEGEVFGVGSIEVRCGGFDGVFGTGGFCGRDLKWVVGAGGPQPEGPLKEGLLRIPKQVDRVSGVSFV